jgi:hypothetical protein
MAVTTATSKPKTAAVKPVDPCAGLAPKELPWPKYRMGKAGVFGSEESVKVVQEAIDYLTCKARHKQGFSEDEKNFLVDFYDGLWWGGWWKGLPEAKMLSNHYVRGGGTYVDIGSAVYEESVIVKDTMDAMKGYIRELQTKKKPVGVLRSDNPGFINSSFFKPISRNAQPPRSTSKQGYVWPKGCLIAEQENQRLQKADNQFYLQSQTTIRQDKSAVTRWSVDSFYDFEAFPNTTKVTSLPIRSGLRISLPDGLSQYMVDLGIAKTFKYGASWSETWKP